MSFNSEEAFKYAYILDSDKHRGGSCGEFDLDWEGDGFSWDDGVGWKKGRCEDFGYADYDIAAGEGLEDVGLVIRQL